MHHQDIILVGKRVLLRHPGRSDLGFLSELWADRATMDPVGGPLQLTEREMAAWFERMVDPGSETDGFFQILLKPAIPIGEVSYHRWKAQERSAELNIKVHDRYRNRGYASEALRLFLRFYFEETGAESLADHVALGNRGAQRFLERFGFLHDSSRSDIYRMTLEKRQYANRALAAGRSSTGVRVEQLGSNDWRRVREIRLQALAEDPEAFGSTLASESKLTDEHWKQRLSRADAATFVALGDRGEDIGLVVAAPYDDAAGLFSMWVSRDCRQKGIGGALVDTVIEWARLRGFGRILLDVGDRNEPAIALYGSRGFRATGTKGSLPYPRDHILEHQLELILHPGNEAETVP